MGRFQPGNPGGPGRPKLATEERYIRALTASVSIADWKEIVDKAVTQAKRGDSRARTWLSDYLLGKPLQRTEVTGQNGGPLSLLMKWEDGDD